MTRLVILMSFNEYKTSPSVYEYSYVVQCNDLRDWQQLYSHIL